MKFGGKLRTVYGECCTTFAWKGVTEPVCLRSIYIWGKLQNLYTFRSCRSVKIGGRLARNARFQAPTCVLLSLWLFSCFAVSIYGGSYKTFTFQSCRSVKFGGVSHEMLVFTFPPVSSCVSGFPLPLQDSILHKTITFWSVGSNHAYSSHRGIFAHQKMSALSHQIMHAVQTSNCRTQHVCF